MESIKIGIAGLGRAGRYMHLSEIADINKKGCNFEICAVCDTIQHRREEVAKVLSCKAYATIEEMVKDDEIEMIDIATRSCDHFAHAKLAMEAGKSVFLEKPMTCTYADAKELFQIAKDCGVKLYIRQNRRFEKKFMQVQKIIESGVLGDVFQVKLTRDSFAYRNDWQTIEQYGGGQLLNWGPHIIDQSLQFCGGDYKELYTEIRQINASGDCEDHIKIVFTGINGRIVDMEISSGVALPMPMYVAYGTRGALVDEGDKLKVKRLPAEWKVEKLPADPGTPETAVPGHSAAARKIDWVEETYPCEDDGLLNEVWSALYNDYVNGVPYPILPEQVLKNMQVIETAKKCGIKR